MIALITSRYTMSIAIDDITGDAKDKFKSAEESVKKMNERLEVIAWDNVKMVLTLFAVLCVLLLIARVINHLRVNSWEIGTAKVISGTRKRKFYILGVTTDPNNPPQKIKTTYPIAVDEDIPIAISPSGRLKPAPQWHATPKMNYVKELFRTIGHFLLGSIFIFTLWGIIAVYIGVTSVFP